MKILLVEPADTGKERGVGKHSGPGHHVNRVRLAGGAGGW